MHSDGTAGCSALHGLLRADSYQGRKREAVLYSVAAHYEHEALLDCRRASTAFSKTCSKLIIIFSSL
ncbi:MAG: hypothetical protein LM590_04440 [Thermofilum sp.]|nr:hypothetical protein [Thermofilum sp.]